MRLSRDCLVVENPLKEVLQKAREQFEFVIIDAAPILTYADTLLFGAHVGSGRVERFAAT